MSQMTDTDIDRALDDAEGADKEHMIRDENGKLESFTLHPNAGEENRLETSELELARNLSSSSELDSNPKRKKKYCTHIKKIDKN